MKSTGFIWITVSLCAAVIGCSALPGDRPAAAKAGESFSPSVGQAGKDVVWVPTPDRLVEKMLDMAQVAPSDNLIDLGSGDGRTVIAAAKRGVKALGIEYNPDMVALSKRNAAKAGAAGKAQFVRADIFESDLSGASVITMFLLPELNLRLRPAILALKPGTRIVSNTFTMGEWEHDNSADLGCGTYCIAYLWIVPAKVEGQWRSEQGALSLRQNFQTISGTLGTAPISNGKLHGEQINFSADAAQYSGRVTGGSIEGTFKSATRSGAWKAER